MAKSPSKLVRFLVWASSGENRDDALVAFDERHAEVFQEFGPSYARWWSFTQAVKSLPYGAIFAVLKIGSIIFRIGK